MTTESRNTLFLEHQEIIQKIIKRNYRLLAALRLEHEDVAQDLAIRMMKAIEGFNSEKSKPMEAYLYCNLQYEILDMKRRHKPHGLTQVKDETRPEFLYLNQKQRDGSIYELSSCDDTSCFDVSEFLNSLSEPEKETLCAKMGGVNLKRKTQKSMLVNMRNKYMALYESERSMIA